jgi:endonuclease YncB( thermonuclease family)
LRRWPPLCFAATWAFVTGQSVEVGLSRVDNSVGMTNQPLPSDRIEVIDRDTVRFRGTVYRLVGFDTRNRCQGALRRGTPPR